MATWTEIPWLYDTTTGTTSYQVPLSKKKWRVTAVDPTNGQITMSSDDKEPEPTHNEHGEICP